MLSLADLEKRIEKIEIRNKTVEKDKAWETSFVRKFLLMFFTYLTIGFYLSSIRVADSWLNAIVPAIAFWLSTLTLPFFKKLWEKYIYRK